MKKLYCFCLCFFLVTISYAQSSATIVEEEFVGPFASWLNVKQFGALGNGTSDETRSLQAALNAVGNSNSTSAVVYLPAGTYRITGMLSVNAKINIKIIGEGPAVTKIIWDGVEGGTMLNINGTAHSSFNRITFDGKNKAYVAVDQSWDGNTPGFFDTGNEYADDQFLNVGVGLNGGFLGHGFAETTITRCKFLNNSVAGVSLGNFNALDVWVWYCYFEDCKVGITNIYGAGNFKVYNSVFKRSVDADIKVANTGEFGVRGNTSIESNQFINSSFTGNPACFVVHANTVLDPVQTLAIELRNQGPNTVFNNVVRTRAGVEGYVMGGASWPNSSIAYFSNKLTIGTGIGDEWGASLNDTFVNRASLISLKEPTLPQTPANNKRKIFEVLPGATSTEIQSIITQASKTGNKSVVHIPLGKFFINSTLIVPAGSDVQIIGDADGDRNPTWLKWTGTAGGTVIKIEGPSKATLRNFSVDGSGIASNIVITNADQVGARVYTNGLQSHANITNLLANKLNNATILAYNFGFSNSKGTSVDIVGGTGKQSKTILFAGAESDNILSHKVAGGGTLLARDVWYESTTLNEYLHMDGKGNFSADGCHISSPPSPNRPQMTINNLDGVVTFIGTQITDRIIINGNGQKSKVYGVSVLQGREKGSNINDHGFLVNSAIPPADVNVYEIRVRDPNANTTGSGSYYASNIGVISPDLIRQILENARIVQMENIPSLPTNVTDLRIHRIWSSNGVTGVEVQGAGVAPQPLEISNFNLSCNGSNSLAIKWNTKNEKNVEQFVVEKSSDGEFWQTKANVKSNNNNSENSYSYTENSITENAFYRIVAYDKSGSVTKSTILKSACYSFKYNLRVYPNPVKSTLTVAVEADKKSSVTLVLLNSKGSVIKEVKGNIIAGNNQAQYNLSYLFPGTYILVAHIGGDVTSVKFIKE